MESPDVGPCPHCGSELEPGEIGFASGVFWSPGGIRGWQRILPVAGGRFVLGILVSTPWLRSRPAHRCTACGALVVPTDR